MCQAMQAAAQVTELEVPLHSRVAWLRHNYSYFEDEHKDVLMRKLDALTKTSGKKVCWWCIQEAFVTQEAFLIRGLFQFRRQL